MRRRLLKLGLLAMLPMLAAPRAEAQRVSADVWIGTGPVLGRVHIGDRDPYDRYVLRRRYERVVVVEPRVIVVERLRPRGRGWHRGWYRKFRRDARVVVVYFDPRHDRWYDRPFRRGLHQVRVYERGGRYFWFDAQYGEWERDRFDYDERDDRYYDRDYDRPRDDRRYDDRYDDRRYDDRYDDRRYDDRYDGRRYGDRDRDRR